MKKLILSVVLLITAFSANPSIAQCSSSDCDLPPALFVSRANLELVKERIDQNVAPYGSIYKSFINVASGALTQSPSPFVMSNIKQISFGWCESAGGADDTLKDLVEKLLADSNKARNLALAFLLSGDQKYAHKAKEFMLAWATKSTLFNAYDFNINFGSASFDGLESGFCNNSWNMMLDSIWQAYGLINFSDTYAILSRNSYSLTATEDAQLGNWLKSKLMPATNSGFHAWTRWADAHPTSGAYERYRSDNHLSWALAGLAAAAAALNDDQMWAYVVKGGAYDDGRSGLYANPSNLESLIGYAVSSTGQVYDQAVRAAEHKGLHYGQFSLWALSLVAQIAEVHSADNYWTFEGHRGGSIADGYDYYARYVAGDLPVPDPQETTDPAFFNFLYEMLVGNDWVSGAREDLYERARSSRARGNGIVTQSIGPVALVTGDQAAGSGPVLSSPPKAPANFRISP